MKLAATDPFWSRFKRGPCCEICRKALLPEHDLLRYSPNPPTWYWVHAECHPNNTGRPTHTAEVNGQKWRLL